MFFEMRFDLGTLDSGERSLPLGYLFEISESPLRGYWKHFLLSRLCEHNIVNICLGGGGERGDNISRGKSQYLPVGGGRGAGGGTIYPGVKCSPPPQPSCMLSFLCNDERD